MTVKMDYARDRSNNLFYRVITFSANEARPPSALPSASTVAPGSSIHYKTVHEILHKPVLPGATWLNVDVDRLDPVPITIEFT